MTVHEDYFRYLTRTSLKGRLYHRYLLYPKLDRMLRGRCLDVGCGLGGMLAFRRNTVGVDVNPHTVADCRRRGLDARVMEPDRLPLRDAEFDSVLLDNVLEHLEQPAPLLGEIRRVLRPGGILVAGVPGQRGWTRDPDHKVFYDEDSLEACVEAAGFVRTRTAFAPLWRSRFLSRKVLQYCVFMQFRIAPLDGRGSA
jgi:SAM-dependent methyltransferase